MNESLGLGCIHQGVVVDRDDPEGLWRVRIQIPGLIEGNGSNWAWPMGTFGGGSPQSGGFRVPKVGAEVGVLFIDGDPDRPVYFPAWYGVLDSTGSELPTPARDVPPNEAADIAVMFETDRYLAYVDERAGKEILVFKDKVAGDMIEWDASGPGITIQASAGLLLKCDGLINIDAPLVQIKGRQVLPSAEPI